MEDFISQDEFNLELSAFDEALINIECDEILVLADKCGKHLASQGSRSSLGET